MPSAQGRHFNFFLGGKIFFYSSVPPDYWKIGKKQHFICSNLTLFIVPFFLSFFLSFFLLFFSFLFSSFFLSFFFFLGGRRPPSPPQMTPMRLLTASVVLSLLMQLQFYILTYIMRQYFDECCLRLHGTPEGLNKVSWLMITSYLAGSTGHAKTDTAEFLTCAFLVIN